MERFTRPRPAFLIIPLAAAALAVGCPSEGPAEDPPEATSLLGARLERPELDPAFQAEQEKLLREAQAELVANPESVEAAIWLGRRTAYLGRYREAIGIYTVALRDHPDEPRLYRHRGHRHITVRELDRAIADLERAARLVAGTADVVEPDGLPNERGIPTSTLQSNIWYHLGLARYLKGDLEGALAAYREDLAVSKNPDSLCATSHWLYMTLRRLGRDDEARAVLEPIDAGMDIIENHDYHKLLLVYRGELAADDLLADAEARGGVGFASVVYGLASLRLVSGDEAGAVELFRRIVDAGSWAAFGHIAAEAELARLT